MTRSHLIALGVGIALADSSVVTLALPEILRAFDLEIPDVAWVLTSYNLGLAVSAVPAGFVARRRPRPVFALGTLVFAGSSLVCGLASGFGVLVAARSVQAVGAALLICAALALLSELGGSDARAVATWTGAGIFGAAIGPAAGGVLTQAFGWESIFLVQVPLALVPLLALHGVRARPASDRPGRPLVAPNVALVLLSGALTAALFLLVLLLVEGWRLDPAVAGVVVTVIPAGALTASRLGPRVGGPSTRAAMGAILTAGGLTALALLPAAAWGWTVAPQVLVGVGLGLAISALTERALAGRSPLAVHGGWTIAGRHAGVVLGLVLLTPVFTASLDRNEERALRAGAAAVLDSAIPPADKIGLAQDVLAEVAAADRSVPDVTRAFEGTPDDEAYTVLERTLVDQLDRAVTTAFSRPFLLAAGLALLALLPILLGRRMSE